MNTYNKSKPSALRALINKDNQSSAIITVQDRTCQKSIFYTVYRMYYIYDLLLDRDHADPADLPAAEFLLEQSVRCFPGKTGKRYPCRGCYHNNLFYIV